jgi:SHS2 domain-containing protein
VVQRGAGFAFVDHTADIGVHAWGTSLGETFEQAGLALATLMGATSPATSGRPHVIRAEGPDLGGLLVAFLNELVFVCETADGVGVAALRVTHLEPRWLEAVVHLAQAVPAADGLAVKAATYHRLHVVEHEDGSAEVRVFLDV